MNDATTRTGPGLPTTQVVGSGIVAGFIAFVITLLAHGLLTDSGTDGSMRTALVIAGVTTLVTIAVQALVHLSRRP